MGLADTLKGRLLHSGAVSGLPERGNPSPLSLVIDVALHLPSLTG